MPGCLGYLRHLELAEIRPIEILIRLVPELPIRGPLGIENDQPIRLRVQHRS